MKSIIFYINEMVDESIRYCKQISGIMSICKKTEQEILNKISELNMGEPNIETAKVLYHMLVMGIEFEKININTTQLYFYATRFDIPQEKIVKHINNSKD